MSNCYIGRLPCGCVVAAVVIDGVDPKEVAKDVAQFIKEGLTVEQADTEYVKANLRTCIHKPKQAVLVPPPEGRE